MRHAAAMRVDYAEASELSDESEESEASDEPECVSSNESAEALSVSGDESNDEGGTLAVERQSTLVVRQVRQRPATLQERAAASLARSGEGRASVSHGKKRAGGSKLARGLHSLIRRHKRPVLPLSLKGPTRSQGTRSIAGRSRRWRSFQGAPSTWLTSQVVLTESMLLASMVMQHGLQTWKIGSERMWRGVCVSSVQMLLTSTQLAGL